MDYKLSHSFWPLVTGFAGLVDSIGCLVGGGSSPSGGLVNKRGKVSNCSCNQMVAN